MSDRSRSLGSPASALAMAAVVAAALSGQQGRSATALVTPAPVQATAAPAAPAPHATTQQAAVPQARSSATGAAADDNVLHHWYP